MKIVSMTDLKKMVNSLNHITGKGAWIYKDAQGYAIKDNKGSNMFKSSMRMTRRDALNHCRAYIEGWQFARDAVISAPRYCTNTLFVKEGGVA